MSGKILFATALMVFGLGQAAHAEEHAPMACGLTFNAKGGGLQVIVGEFVLKGPGMITCKDVDGNEVKMPVRVRIGGRHPVALKVAAGYLHAYGAATGIGYVSSPSELMGTYLALNADASVGVGVGANVAAHYKRSDAATLDVNIQVEKGLGFNLGFTSLTISPAE